MGKVKVKMNHAAARRLLNSGEVQSMLLAKAEAVRDAANASLDAPGSSGYEAYVQPGANRARAVAHTTDWASRRHNANTNALLKGLG